MFLLVLGIVGLFAGTHAAPNFCTVQPTSSHPYRIDLSSLASVQDYTAHFKTETFQYVFNICKAISFTDQACPQGTMVCEQFQGASSVSYGSVNSYTLSHAPKNPNNITAILRTKGTVCTGSKGGFSTTEISFRCSHGGGFLHPVVTNEDIDTCSVQMEFPTAAACGVHVKVSKSTDGGGILLIVFFVLLIVYFIAGAVWHHRNGKRGADMIPNLSFWSSLPGLIKDGFKFTKSKATGSQESYGSYSRL